MENSTKELSRLSDLIGLIYKGATDPSRWNGDILPAIAGYLQATKVFLLTAERSPQLGGFFFSHGSAQVQVDHFLNHHFLDMPWVPVALQRGLVHSNSVFVGSDLISMDEWLSSSFFSGILASREDMAMMMAGIVFGLDAPGFQHTALALYRGIDHSPFEPGDRSRLKLLLPHISRSIGVMNHLRTAELTVASTLASLDRLPSGVLLLDEGGGVAFANRAAQRLLGQGTALFLQRGGANSLGRLGSGNSSVSRALDTAIQTTLRYGSYDIPSFSSAVKVPHDSGCGYYTLQFSALGSQNEFGGGRVGFSAIAFIASSTQQPQITPSVLQKLYGLTPAEADVALAFVEHDSVKDVACVLGTSPNTVRTQLRQIYAKLGVDTRTRFVKVMLGLASGSTENYMGQS